MTFPDKELGKAIPYGVYDLAEQSKAGSASGSIMTRPSSPSTAFGAGGARWGGTAFRSARTLLITADGGGSNGTAVAAVEGRLADAWPTSWA